MEELNFISFWKVAISVAGLGAITCFVFYSLYRQWLSLDIFSVLTKRQTFLLMRLFLILTFIFATTGLTFYFWQDAEDIDPFEEVRQNLSKLEMDSAVNKACLLFKPDHTDPIVLPDKYMERLFQQFYEDSSPPTYNIKMINGYAHPAADFRRVSSEYAMHISLRRADAARDYMMQQLGVLNISTRGYGLEGDAEMIGPYICGAKLRVWDH